jgi:hypothetical protein
MWKKERNWFHPPWRDNMEIHMPAITTQERKWGRYETTWTYFRKPFDHSSLSKMAKTTKQGNNSTYFMKLITNVFFRILKNSGLPKIIRKYFSPTKVQSLFTLKR